MRRLFVICGLATAWGALALCAQDRDPHQQREERRREEGRNAHDAATSVGTTTFTVSPSNLTTGQRADLAWEIERRDPAVPVQGAVEIEYAGLNSGVWRDLPQQGTREVCPLGDTVYTLRLRSSRSRALTLGTRRVTAPCPSASLTQEMLQTLVDGLQDELAAYDSGIKVRSLKASIGANGITLAMRGVKRLRSFPDMEIKVDLRTTPRAEGGVLRAPIRDFDVDIGSTETRIAWDVITAGQYEIVKAALEAYFQGKYRKTAQERLEEQLASLVALPPSALPVITYQPGSMSIAVCLACS